MHNPYSPTTLTLEQFNTSASIQISRSDIDLKELFSMFESLIISAGYQKKSLDNLILEIAKNQNEYSNTEGN